jgi:hypothetical protein
MQAQNFFAGALCLVKAGLTGLSGAATTFSTGVTIVASLLGKAISKAAVAGGATPTTDAATGLAITLKANFGTVVLWCLDADGNVKVLGGTTEALDESGNFIAAPQFAAVTDDLVPFAYSVHKAGATTVGTWTFGTSLWNATGLTHTAVDIIAIPNRPQIA